MAEILKRIKTQILLRSDIATNWSTHNPVLGAGEIGVEFREGGAHQFKIGDNSTPWNSLPYFEGNLADAVANLRTDVNGIQAVLNDNGDTKGLVSRVGVVETKVQELIVAGGEPNVIVEVQLDGVKVEPENKVVNLDVAATYVKKSDFEAYKTEITNKFGEYTTTTDLNATLAGYVTTGKFNEEIAKLATTEYVNAELAKKVSNDTFTTYQGTVTEELAKKADKTEVENTFANYETKAQAEAKYVQATSYAIDKAALEEAIGSKVAQSAYNTDKAALEQAIAGKVAQTAYDAKVEELENSIEALQAAQAGGLVREIVTELPAVDNASLNTIYMIKRAAGVKDSDVYDEYIIVIDKETSARHFELLGNTELNLSGYATEDYVNGKVEAIYAVDAEGNESGKLVDKIAAEATTRENAIAAETTAREAIYKKDGEVESGVLVTKLAAEVKAREDADKALGERIDGVVEAAKDYATKAELEAEAKARGDKDTELENAITEVTKENGTIDTKVAAAKTALEAEIAKKADKTAFEGHVAEFEAHVEAYEAHAKDYADHLTAQAEKDEAQDNALAAEATARKAIYDVVEGTESGVLVTKLAAEAEARGALADRVKAIEDLGLKANDTYATKVELEAEAKARGDKDTELANDISENAAAIENISKEGGLIDQKVDAAKYITDVDADVFKVESYKLSLNPTTVFVLNGGGASGWSEEA